MAPILHLPTIPWLPQAPTCAGLPPGSPRLGLCGDRRRRTAGALQMDRTDASHRTDIRRASYKIPSMFLMLIQLITAPAPNVMPAPQY